MKTKIYYGRDLIGRFNCDGRKHTKFQLFRMKAVRMSKRVMIVMFGLSVLGWSFYAGSQFIPKTVVAEVQVSVKESMKFEDIPMLVKICKAESGGKQFKANGDVLRGKVNPSDIGFCQINEQINNDLARKLGYDIYTEKGNKDFAMYLYFTQGVQPWKSSQVMWSK